MLSGDTRNSELTVDETIMEGLVGNSPASIYVLDKNMNIVFDNASASRRSGYSCEELCSMNFPELDFSFPVKQLNEIMSYSDIGAPQVFESEHVNKPAPLEEYGKSTEV